MTVQDSNVVRLQRLDDIEWRISTACRLAQTPPLSLDPFDTPLLRAAERYAYALTLGGDVESAAAEYQAALNQFQSDFADKMYQLSQPQPKEHDTNDRDDG